MKVLDFTLAAVLAVASLGAYAQAGKILKGDEVNEANLIDALVPAPKTRSLRVSADKAAPAKAASASMLITFETNSAELTPQSRQILDKLGRALQSDKLAEFKFAIEGHADPRGGEQFNLQLSQARAEKVVSYLADNMQIDRARLKPVGKGQSELMNTSNPDAPENRRVTVKTLLD